MCKNINYRRTIKTVRNSFLPFLSDFDKRLCNGMLHHPRFTNQVPLGETRLKNCFSAEQDPHTDHHDSQQGMPQSNIHLERM